MPQSLFVVGEPIGVLAGTAMSAAIQLTARRAVTPFSQPVDRRHSLFSISPHQAVIRHIKPSITALSRRSPHGPLSRRSPYLHLKYNKYCSTINNIERSHSKTQQEEAMKTSSLATCVFCIIFIISTANGQVQPDRRRRKSPPTPPPPSPPPPSPPPPSPPPPSPNELEYFIFVQQWPAGYCYFNQDDCVRNKLVNDFCIHGIWPADSSGVSLRGCADPKPFQASFVKPIERDLKTYWPSFSSKLSDQKFWEHEWREHGICSTKTNPSLYGGDYFRGALQMKRALDIYGILSNIGVVPNDGNSKYNVAKIRREITMAVSSTIYLECKNHGTTYFLVEVRVCYNKALQYVSCPQRGCEHALEVVYLDKSAV
ncbi:hypothetical protein LguiA_025678 [Lonicera macranthoides]